VTRREKAGAGREIGRRVTSDKVLAFLAKVAGTPM